MKIATYNIWNSEQGMPERAQHILLEIRKTEADVICLQEVPHQAMAEEMAQEAGYPVCFFVPYPQEAEGLCILSRMPLRKKISCMETANAIFASFTQGGKQIGVLNLHLPWDSALERERQMVALVSSAALEACDEVYMAGDFNCTETADVQRFLDGECTLQGQEANPRWFDLAASDAQRRGTKPVCTLNFLENPRFQRNVRNTIEVNARYDRILLRNPYPHDFPVLKSCTVFGQTVYPETQLAASDHYGVLVEVEET